MKIQLSETKIIKDALCIWNEPGPEVDMAIDVTKLPFREGSVDEIYSLHVLDRLFEHEVLDALKCWKKCLKKKGKLYIVVNDFEYLARSFIGGELPLDEFNKTFTRPAFFTRESVLPFMKDCGFNLDHVVFWFMDVPDLIKKQPFELIMCAENI